MKGAHERRAEGEKYDKDKGQKKPQSVFPDKVHAARVAKHGHAYPAVTARPHTVLGYSMQRQMSSSAHFHNGCTHQGAGSSKAERKNCPHCGAMGNKVLESEEHALLWCPKHAPARRRLLEATGWPRDETALVAEDAVRWMVPSAAQATCSERQMATSVQEFCQAIAWTRGSREGAAKKAARETGGIEGTEDGGDETEAEEEDGEKASGSGAAAVNPLRRSARIRGFHSRETGLRWGGGSSGAAVRLREDFRRNVGWK